MPKFVRLPIALLAVLVPFTSSNVFAGSTTIKTGDGLIELTANMPEETRVGEQFTYTVTVTNSSSNVTLHDIELLQRKAAGFQVESAKVMKDGQKKEQQKSKNKPEGKNQKKDSEQNDSSEKQSGDKSSQQSSKNGRTMTVKMLKPGESRTIKVTASADNEGQLRSCLEIVNYKPAICLTASVVKPELEITKTAPKKVNRCDVIELEYTVKNGGSGDLGTFQVVDELADGIKTVEGNSKLQFDVDGLKAGETRTFVGSVYANQTGKFSSRAIAKAPNADLKSRSKETTTNVVAADLTVSIDGPSKLYGDDLATFTATIRNTGNAVAQDVKANVMWPEFASLVDMGEPQRMKADKNQKSGSNDQQQTANSSSKQSSSQESSQSGKSNSEAKMDSEMISIGKLAPGESIQIEYAIRPNDLDQIPTRIEATHVCTLDVPDARETAKAEATTTGFAVAQMVRLPALQVVVVDDEDPVRKGTQVKYTIRVLNEGDAPDNNLQLTAELPEGLKFVKADGPTKEKAENSTITFKPIDTLEPGDRVEYTLIAECTGNGAVELEAMVKSDAFNKPTRSSEPTRLYGGDAAP